MECRVGTNLFGHSGGVDGGTVRIFFLFGPAVAGTVRLKLVMGGGLFFIFFLQFAVSSFGGWMSAVGILCYVFFVGGFVVFSCGFFFLKLLIFSIFITGGLVAVRT